MIDNIQRFHHTGEIPDKPARIMELTIEDRETGLISKFTITLGRGGYGYPKMTIKTRSRKGKLRTMSLGCVPSEPENWLSKKDKKKNRKMKAE